MTSNFFKNLYLGMELTEEEYENIPNPRFELHTHVMYKCTEAGTILGMGVFGPILGLIKGRNISTALTYSAKGGKIGFVVGALLAPCMVEGLLRGKDIDAFYDRSYRIRHNKNQLRTDRSATLGALVGTLITRTPTGFLMGYGGGTVGAGVYNNFVLKKR